MGKVQELNTDRDTGEVLNISLLILSVNWLKEVLVYPAVPIKIVTVRRCHIWKEIINVTITNRSIQ